MTEIKDILRVCEEKIDDLKFDFKINKDNLKDIISYSDLNSTINFLSTNKRLWKLKWLILIKFILEMDIEKVKDYEPKKYPIIKKYYDFLKREEKE